MHCAALLSHTKIVITDAEKTVRPRPKRLICTGPRARDVMVRYGGHSPDEVQAGSALRQTYLSQVQHRKRLNRPIKNILVVLDGLPTTFQFVMFIYRALEGNRNFQTTIRPHPAQTAEIILRETGLREPHLESIRFSRNKEITQDLEGADIVVYKGSTAAMEAGYMGIPLVHVESGNLLTDDPLFEIDSLKKVARTPEELVTAIKHFSDMSDGEFDCQLKSLRNYVEEYLSMPSEETISPFFPISAKPHLESIRFSRNKEITQDLEGADIVVYKGSTAAMEAGYMGIPLVHVESGNLLTDDPLFEIDSLKKVARTPEELVTAIKHFSDMSDGEFDCQLKSLRNYVEEYLSMPSEETISPFFPISTAVGAS